MTIKYIYVLQDILGEDDERFKDLKSFFSLTSTGDYYVPIDSNVLKELDLDKRFGPWSKLDKEDYMKV